MHVNRFPFAWGFSEPNGAPKGSFCPNPKRWIGNFELPLTRSLAAMIFLLLGSIPTDARSGEQILKVIELHSRPASEIVNLIAPFLDPYGTAVANGNQLILKTSPANFAEVLNLINQLDKRLAEFQISILQNSRLSLNELNANANVYGKLSGRDSHFGANGHLYQSDSKIDGEITQLVRTMEGKAAHIEVGQAIPVPSYTGPAYGRTPHPAVGLRYQSATTGFAVVPRMAGEEVLLEVFPWSERPERRGGGVVHTQSAHTTLRAPLGRWVSFAGQDYSETGSAQGIAKHYERTGKNTSNFYIRIDRIH